MMRKRTLTKVIAAISIAVLMCLGSPTGYPPAIQAIAELSQDKGIPASPTFHDDGVSRDGQDTYTWETGETYNGEWLNGVINGQGCLTWPGIGSYTGSFINGIRSGEGTFAWEYEGVPATGDLISISCQWVDDAIGEYVTIEYYEVGTYSGYINDKGRCDQGTFTWLTGDTYTGSWMNDQINGEGTMTMSDGTILSGTFLKGKLTTGTMTYPVKDGTASRKVVNGTLDATVTTSYFDGTIIKGRVADNEYTGNVTITYTDGAVYSGAVTDGKKEGRGTYTWPNGAHYVGAWKDDTMNGAGIYYYTASEECNYLKGSFENGVPSGTLVYVTDQKIRYTTVWENSECISITEGD